MEDNVLATISFILLMLWDLCALLFKTELYELTTTWAPFSLRGLGLINGDIMYSSSTKATMKAATTRSIMKGRSSHQELKESQCESAEPRAFSEDMGQPDADDVSSQAKCPITGTPLSRGQKITGLRASCLWAYTIWWCASGLCSRLNTRLKS